MRDPSETLRPTAATTGFPERIARAATVDEKVALTARWILREFDTYYSEFLRIPSLAKAAFERRDWARSLALSKRRLSLYSASIETLGPRLRAVFPLLAEQEAIWGEVQAQCLPSIEGWYEADLTFAYINSVHRMIYQGEWKPVEYGFGNRPQVQAGRHAQIVRTFPAGAALTPATAREILRVPSFAAPYWNLDEDAALIAERVNENLRAEGHDPAAVSAIEMVDAGFYRNRGAYLVGRMVLDDASVVPLIIALLNSGEGIFADAVMTAEADAHNIFSSTLANFHVDITYYHQLIEFLHSVMPQRPLGLHYSTIGFNHVGKVAVMNELKSELASTGEVFRTAVGFRGTVAIGFSAPTSNYNLKVIRDQPTSQYKWGKFEGIESVLQKYSRVHEINRTGSMLDNIIYYNLKLDAAWFDPALLEELLREASRSVSLRGDSVILKYLIVQRRMTPLPVFLAHASEADAQTAVVNLGHCIKNNAAANIFNKDLDARNYGVSRFLKVYLYDYDALEPFTEVKIRTNRDRIDGEEDIPEWYFEEGPVFLPEEIESGLRLPTQALLELLRRVHGDLSTMEYWERLQQDLRVGRVPTIRVYPEERRLRPSRPES